MTRVSDDSWDTAVALLQVATQLVDGVQAGLTRRGFDDVRPAHGFAFVRISAGDATTADVAVHLGISKQAAAQLVDHLVSHGYVERRPDPRDARARLLVLTGRGRACTAAAEAAAAETVDRWQDRLSPPAFRHLSTALAALAEPGRLRPIW
jgi:DNA-binding MarR family transcriptional regulator